MKKLRLILVAFGLLATIASTAQTTLTYKLANPRIVYSSGTNYFAFDVQVKAAALGSFLWSGQAIINFDNTSLTTNLSGFTVLNGPLLSGTYGLGTAKYNSVLVTLTGTPLKLNLAFTANSASTETNMGNFNEITTSFQTLATVYAAITNVAGLPGIAFDQASMNGQVFYKLAVAPWFTGYVNPNLYDPSDFTNIYLGRIYANGSWSQFGGTVDWTTAVNTSVWDGTPSTTIGILANASALRVHAGASLTIPSNGSMTVTGATDIVATGNLTFASDATGTGSFITGSATGTAIAQRYLTSAGSTAWHLIAAPVTGMSIPTFVGNVSNAIATSGALYGLAPFVTATGWAHYTTTTLAGAGNFTAGQGYEILRSADGVVSFSGVPGFAAQSTGIATAGGVNYWNLLGNPYPSAIYANIGANANNFLTTNAGILEASHQAIYIWDPTTSAYITINQASGATNIPAGQAFFVSSAAAGGTASITTAMKTHGGTAFKSAQSEYPSIRIMANIAGASKSTQIYYISGTTLGMDPGYDAATYEESATVGVSTHVLGSELDFAIQSLPDNDYENTIIPVGLNGPQGGNVRFTMEMENLPSGTKVYLEDRAAGKFTRMDLENSSYSVNLPSASKGIGRFFIHTTQGILGIDTQNEDLYTIIPLPSQHQIRVLGAVEPNSIATIYEMNGAVAAAEILNNLSENVIPFMPLSNGIYMLKIQSGTKLIQKKINWVY